MGGAPSRRNELRERVLSLISVFASSCVVMSLALFAATPPIDDAYITFRYARNLALGLGLVYNRGETVLGTTSPLWAALLSPFVASEVPIEIVAVGLAWIAVLFSAELFRREYLAPVLGEYASLVAAPLMALSFYPLSTSFSGMETSLYCLAIMCVFVLLIHNRRVAAATVGCAATLLRPDGLLLVLVSIASRRASPKSRTRAVLVSSILLSAWGLFCLRYYENLLPFSVTAKRVVHSASPLKNLLIICDAVSSNAYDFAVFTLGISGLVLFGIYRSWMPLAWASSYFIGLVLSGVRAIFFWYYTPLYFTCLSFGVLGWITHLKRRGVSLRFISYSLVLLTAVSSVTSILLARIPDTARLREETYHQIGARFAASVAPGQRIYACETGVIGYEFPDAYIIDSSGITSPQVLAIRRQAFESLVRRGIRWANPDRYSNWSAQVIDHFKPDLIISPRGWCQLIVLEDDLAFQSAYRREALLSEQHLSGIGVYRRK